MGNTVFFYYMGNFFLFAGALGARTPGGLPPLTRITISKSYADFIDFGENFMVYWVFGRFCAIIFGFGKISSPTSGSL